VNAQTLNAYLKRHNSPLAGYGQSFIRAGRQYGVSPALLVAIAGAESSFGKITSGNHNPFGYGPGIDFPSWDAAISTVAKGLKQNYLSQGRTSIQAIGAKWAPQGASNDPTDLNANWAKNVEHFYNELKGGALSTPTASPSAPPSVQGPDSSSGPDLSQFAIDSLGQIGKGYDPLKSLSDLTDMIAASGGASLSAPKAASDKPVKGGFTYTGQKFTHDTPGLPGFPAVDLFAKPGTPFLAPESGKIVRLSGRGGTSGNVFGYSVYFQGDSGKLYFLTHLQKARPGAGTRIRAGQKLGLVSAWKSGSPHVHVGIKQ